MTIPSAKAMSTAIASIFSDLHSNNLIQDYDGPIRPMCGRLNKIPDGQKWALEVSSGMPIRFKETTDKNGDPIIPEIIADLEVDPSKETFPYLKWQIALEIKRPDQSPVARWHFDLAEPGQSAPKIHMQCGGHFANGTERDKEIPLKTPRWHHHAVDLLLLTEIVISSFYHDEWQQARLLPKWCPSINKSQHLCLLPYVNQIKDKIEVSGTTVMSQLWNGTWT